MYALARVSLTCLYDYLCCIIYGLSIVKNVHSGRRLGQIWILMHCICTTTELLFFPDTSLRFWKTDWPIKWITRRSAWTFPDRTLWFDSRLWLSRWWPTNSRTLMMAMTSTFRTQVSHVVLFLRFIVFLVFWCLRC